MKSKTSAALILLVTFALGATAGGIGYHLAQRQVAAVDDRHPNPRNAPGHLVKEMAEGLNMDAAQKTQLEEIVGRSRERYRSLSEQFRPQYDAIRNETRQEIRRILREDQKQRFEELIAKIDDRHKGGPQRVHHP
jgi:Spy/CpxP family protein refolding chaperone